MSSGRTQLAATTVPILDQQLVVGQRQSGVAARNVYPCAVAAPIRRPDRHRITDELGVRADVRPAGPDGGIGERKMNLLSGLDDAAIFHLVIGDIVERHPVSYGRAD